MSISIVDARKNWERLSVEDVSIDSIDATSEQLEAAQSEQMLHGVKQDGAPIGLYRNEEYATMKHAMNPLAGFGNVDLKLTGDFMQGFEVNVFPDSFIVESTDEKAKELEEKYGDVFGVGGEFKNKYVDESLRPVFLKKVKEVVKL